MKFKKNDNVKVIVGKDKGKQGKITQVFPVEKKVVVEGVNVAKKHLRPRKQGEGGQVIEFFAPLLINKVQLVCPKCGKLTRIGINITPEGKKTRVCKKCKASI